MRNNKGFTLIELLIVVVIIGILAAIAIPKFSATREKAYRSTMQADLRNLATQQELFYSDNYTYSTDLTALGFVQSRAVTVTVGVASATGWSATSTHDALAGEQCDTGHGSEGDGEIVCTVP
jgi:prepilin-type N-terminal cleavage/methylation domain-containing protein